MTTRAQPTKSWETAWRHLFRHISEPKELRRNPIAANFLARIGASVSDADAPRAIRSALLDALDECEVQLRSSGHSERARRRRAIVESHVLGHRSATELASDLHISRMQLYRERRVICEHLARVLTDSATARTPKAVAQVSDPRLEAIARARLLIEQCQSERALVVFDDVASTSGNPQTAIPAMCSIGDALTARLELEKARRPIEAARQLVLTSEAELGNSFSFFRSCVELAAARLASQNGRSSQARRTSRRALDDLLARPLADESQREIAVDELTEAAGQALREGRFKEFRMHLSAANAAFGTLRERSPRQKARLVLQTALLYEETCGAGVTAGRDACRMLAQAYDIASRAGLQLIAADAALSRAGVLAYDLGDPSTAVREASPIAEFALRSGDRRVIGDFCSYVAGLKNANREFRDALRLADLASRYGRLDAGQEAFVHSVVAQAHFGLAEYHLAGPTAERAVELASRTGNRRLMGRMLQISALSLHARRLAPASERIDRAIDLLERFGCSHSLRHAYRASSIITGNREHARRARSLAPRV
jgi:hypothetical protein